MCTAVERASTHTFVQAHGPIVYQLPQQRIAVHPLEDRAASKLMVRRRGRLCAWCAPSECPRVTAAAAELGRWFTRTATR
jgi:hypothetical protein